MKGLYLGNDEKYLEKVSQAAGELSLLAKGGKTEVMLQKINAGEFFCIEPGGNFDIMEFFYIQKGSILYEYNNRETILKEGDYFYVHSVQEPVHFQTLEEVKLIYVCSEPIFQHLSLRIRKIAEMVRKVEEKDVYTYNHGSRVKDYSIKIAKKLHFSSEKLEMLGFAAICHDVGKVYVPDEILNKPSKLTEDEMDYIKKHPIDGSEMVKNTFYHNIHKFVEQHHERLDGSGYPYGLKDEEILLEAKIIAVADTYDAMTTDRAYRKGMDPMTSVNELRRLSGIHYDKNVVAAFEEVLKEEGIIN